MSPQTNDVGKASWARSDSNQSPLESPWAAESQAFRVIGPVSGAASCVVSIRPKKLAIRALPFLIGRNNHRFGMCATVRFNDAARSPVGLAQASSLAQRAAYLRICSSVVLGFQR